MEQHITATNPSSVLTEDSAKLIQTKHKIFCSPCNKIIRKPKQPSWMDVFPHEMHILKLPKNNLIFLSDYLTEMQHWGTLMFAG